MINHKEKFTAIDKVKFHLGLFFMRMRYPSFRFLCHKVGVSFDNILVFANTIAGLEKRNTQHNMATSISQSVASDFYEFAEEKIKDILRCDRTDIMRRRGLYIEDQLRNKKIEIYQAAKNSFPEQDIKRIFQPRVAFFQIIIDYTALLLGKVLLIPFHLFRFIFNADITVRTTDSKLKIIFMFFFDKFQSLLWKLDWKYSPVERLSNAFNNFLDELVDRLVLDTIGIDIKLRGRVWSYEYCTDPTWKFINFDKFFDHFGFKEYPENKKISASEWCSFFNVLFVHYHGFLSTEKYLPMDNKMGVPLYINEIYFRQKLQDEMRKANKPIPYTKTSIFDFKKSMINEDSLYRKAA